MNKRDVYLNKLINFKDKNLIKVITGMRRSGKSTLLLLYKEYLLESKVKKENIILINFESVKYKKIKTYEELYDYISDIIKNVRGKKYILLDEVQMVNSWEKAINSFMIDFDCDVYITGSNAHLLSSELSTLLSGRYVEIKMMPLSFKEYLDFNNFDFGKLDFNNITFKNKEELFQEYLKYGGLPIISELKKDESVITTYLKDIYNTVIMKDVIERNDIKDIALLNNIMTFVAQNTGSIVSPNKINNYLKNDGLLTSHNTVDNYLMYLEKAYIVYKVPRYDIKGKLLLKTLGKYYIVDTGIMNVIAGYRDTDFGHILENIVYLELLRRGYHVYIGKNNDYEIDFVAVKESDKRYYQVAYKLTDDVMERETRALDIPSDHYEKIIISSDNNYIKDIRGIKLVNIIDFLLEE